ncbi:ion transporter [Eubacterium oxidoreducens]|uniref:Voltage-gated potassium channel n=1 Tax=Eubacterium oxidoreducens TaxID=1732 RepID=A0A1G6AGQ4_EUBOX|nr:ion transporter [Eubacterium oxidoreducens]SDB07510.1 voltage-gated potassium channel [Eubacterium oxidoreducens]
MEHNISFKKRLYEIIEVSNPEDKASKAYDFMMYVAIAAGLLPLTVKTSNTYTHLIDIITVLLFLVDYIARIATADYKMGYKHYRAYFAYALTPLAIVDLLSVLPILNLFFPSTAVFGAFRVFRVLRALKLARYSKTMVAIVNVLKYVRHQLVAVLVLTVLYIVISAMAIFQVEPDQFGNFFDAIYWSTISITTIGYGDIVPETVIGKLITIVSSLVGVAIIALPSGIITAAYIREMKRKKSEHEVKHL